MLRSTFSITRCAEDIQNASQDEHNRLRWRVPLSAGSERELLSGVAGSGSICPGERRNLLYTICESWTSVLPQCVPPQ